MSGWLKLNFPGASYVGPGAVEALGPAAADLGRRALLITGRRALREAGITDRLTDLLAEAGVESVLFEEVPPEPELATVDDARSRLRAERCDLVVAVGGGSAMDAGKLTAALAQESAPTGEFHAGGEITRPGLPHIAVATTSGTGAEVTRNGVITDPDSGLKKSIRGDGVMPTVSITDAELTLSCPPEVTAASGMDALVQAIESFFSVHTVRTTRALSLAAVRSVAPKLPVAFEDGRDHEARAALAEGSYMAGLALGSARLGAVHGLAHPVGLCTGLPHGVVCAALLPPVLERNLQVAPERYEELREAMGGDPLQMLRNLLDELDLPHTLGRYPAPEWERRILDYALNSGSSRANPVAVDGGFGRGVLRAVTRRS